MGEPSATDPWGWQLDGHHLAINFFMLGDQVVMTPAFWGSEPAVAEAGKYAGTRIMDEEQEKGLALIRGLDAAQSAHFGGRRLEIHDGIVLQFIRYLHPATPARPTAIRP